MILIFFNKYIEQVLSFYFMTRLVLSAQILCNYLAKSSNTKKLETSIYNSFYHYTTGPSHFLNFE